MMTSICRTSSSIASRRRRCFALASLEAPGGIGSTISTPWSSPPIHSLSTSSFWLLRRRRLRRSALPSSSESLLSELPESLLRQQEQQLRVRRFSRDGMFVGHLLYQHIVAITADEVELQLPLPRYQGRGPSMEIEIMNSLLAPCLPLRLVRDRGCLHPCSGNDVVGTPPSTQGKQRRR